MTRYDTGYYSYKTHEDGLVTRSSKAAIIKAAQASTSAESIDCYSPTGKKIATVPAPQPDCRLCGLPKVEHYHGAYYCRCFE